MKNPILMTILGVSTLALAGCSGAEVTEDVVSIPVEYTTNVSVAEETSAEAVPLTLRSDVQRINAGEFLRTLVAAGCQPKEARYREVEGAVTGANVSVTCRETGDPLDLEVELQ